MSDDLLDEALARANRYSHATGCPCDPDRDPYVGCACGETRREDLRRDVRALVERVREVEAERETCYSDECGEPCQSWQAMKRAEVAEYKRQAETAGQRLGEVRGKLDAVRALVINPPAFVNREHRLSIYGHGDFRDDVLAIIDAEGSTRPQEATGDASGTPGPDNA